MLLGERHLRAAVRAYVNHYHEERPHQLGNELIAPTTPAIGTGPITCRDRLGGLLKFYDREVARWLSFRTTRERTRVFVSYSHHDSEWLQRLQVHLRPLVRSSTIDLWDDTNIAPGSKWRDDIERALASAKVAILLVTADFFASDFIAEIELPTLLEAAQNDGALIMPINISPSRVGREAALSAFQAVNDPRIPLINLPAGGQEAVFDEVAQRIELAVGRRELREKFDAVVERLEEQQQVLNDQVYDYRYRHSAPMSREMYSLRDIGFIQPRPPRGGFLDFDDRLDGVNVAELVEPTPIGWSCIRLRKSDVPQDWFSDEHRHNLRMDRMRELT